MVSTSSVTQKKAMGSDLYEQVFYSLDLIEKDYFGLQFTDANHVKHWLDPTKAVKKQVKSTYGRTRLRFSAGDSKLYKYILLLT